MAVAGLYQYKSGMDKGREAEIHVEAIRELGGSFDAALAPLVVEVEGKQLKLSGSAENQYRQWRKLVQEIYTSETGFTPAGDSTEDTTVIESVERVSDQPRGSAIHPRYDGSDQGPETH